VFETEIHPLRACPHGPAVYCLYLGNFAGVAELSRVEAAYYGLRIKALENAASDLTVETLARQHLEAIRAITPDGPYTLLGYSFGGLVAYELAVQLRQAGEQVALLGLFDTPHPGFRATLSPQELEVALQVYRADRARKYWTNLKTGRIDWLTRDALVYAARKLRPLSWQMARLAGKALGHKPLAASPELRVDAMWHAYRPPHFDGQLLLIRAQGRDAEFAGDPTMGWHKSALRGVDVKFSSGSHESMMAAEHAMELAEILAPAISSLTPQPQ
jgi:acetoacetyl-CoA synthetase